MPRRAELGGLRVALVNPPYFPRFSRAQRSPGVIKSGTMYYPYWLAHATAVLDERGFDVLLCDAPASNQSAGQVLDRLGAYGPDLCVVETSTASAESDGRFAEAI